MSRVALIESLRDKAAEDIESVWREARADADRFRAGLAQALEQRRAQVRQATAAASRRLEETAEAEAQRRARESRMNSAIELAGRLHRLALAQLPRLRSEGGGAMFGALARELPDREWQAARVNPADRDLARQHFPRANVTCAEAIAGGMAVEAEGGRIVVDNTLETRLATAWPDILPALIASLVAEVPARGTGA